MKILLIVSFPNSNVAGPVPCHLIKTSRSPCVTRYFLSTCFTYLFQSSITTSWSPLSIHCVILCVRSSPKAFLGRRGVPVVWNQWCCCPYADKSPTLSCEQYAATTRDDIPALPVSMSIYPTHFFCCPCS